MKTKDTLVSQMKKIFKSSKEMFVINYPLYILLSLITLIISIFTIIGTEIYNNIQNYIIFSLTDAELLSFFMYLIYLFIILLSIVIGIYIFNIYAISIYTKKNNFRNGLKIVLTKRFWKTMLLQLLYIVSIVVMIFSILIIFLLSIAAMYGNYPIISFVIFLSLLLIGGMIILPILLIVQTYLSLLKVIILTTDISLNDSFKLMFKIKFINNFIFSIGIYVIYSSIVFSTLLISNIHIINSIIILIGTLLLSVFTMYPFYHGAVKYLIEENDLQEKVIYK